MRIRNVGVSNTCMHREKFANNVDSTCSVPLDYTNPSAGVAKIALGRYNATAWPRKGVVFVNPGGPGGSGVGLATSAGPYFQELVSTDQSDAPSRAALAADAML